MPEFAFDVNLRASLRVEAEDEATARAILAESLNCADSNFGAWPDGSPITAEASMDGDASLYMIDGKDAHDGLPFAWPSDGVRALQALRAILPYAESRAEDMLDDADQYADGNDLKAEAAEAACKAVAAVDAAKALLASLDA